MEIKGDSIIDTVIEYASMKFGREIPAEEISKQLRELKLSQTLDLVDAMKTEDSDRFLEHIDITVNEAYGTVGTGTASRATQRKQNTTNAQMNRADKKDRAVRGGGAERTTAGVGSGTGMRKPASPEDGQRDTNTVQSQGNADEIERLKSLVTKMASKR
ncbi:hypothetical protein N8072_00850 [bacterium]|nr:hypothetical protein [bacterium]MDC1257208.1 hypothetical protein [bacterium]